MCNESQLLIWIFNKQKNYILTIIKYQELHYVESKKSKLEIALCDFQFAHKNKLSNRIGMNTLIEITAETVINKIYFIRGKKVMLDRDLAEMYGIETRRLNEQVKRNEKRFPADFMFQLSKQELEDWKSKNATTKMDKMGLRKLPNVFTEQGVAMLSSVINSETAIEVNIQIIRIFTHIREVLLMNNNVLLKMEALEKMILNQNEKTNKQEEEIQLIFIALKQLLNPPQEPRQAIGFKTSPKNNLDR